MNTTPLLRLSPKAYISLFSARDAMVASSCDDLGQGVARVTPATPGAQSRQLDTAGCASPTAQGPRVGFKIYTST